MTTYLYRLPTTGYVILHTSIREGEEPRLVTCFIDGGDPTMDDAAAAIARVEKDKAGIERYAPCNVAHTLRLVHRTAEGDRHLMTAGPINGNGPALAN